MILKSRNIKPGYLGLALVLIGILLTFSAVTVSAAPQKQVVSNEPSQETIDNDTCLGCHGIPGVVLTLENGEIMGLFINSDDFENSIHGFENLQCVDCHVDNAEYPHPPFIAENVRDASIQLYEACQRCHTEEYELTLDSVHNTAHKAGRLEAAICTDCHTAHAVQQLTDPDTGELLPESNTWIPLTCANCHNAIYQKYLTSAHGSALIGEANPDVPTCIDCHGVHDIKDPTTVRFRLDSPLLCANCHQDPERMDKYGISTEVVNTYVADFHGTTVTLFEKQSPDAVTNKPVCFDCHGIHDIISADDPEKGLNVRENILSRCQRCHPDATSNFPDAWLSHYIPSLERTPIIFSVNLFYNILIPGTLGGMAVLVGLDITRRTYNRIKARKPDPIKPETGRPIEPTSSKPTQEAQGQRDQESTND
jgi:hypothetical protein